MSLPTVITRPTLKGGSFNLRYGRDHDRVRYEVIALARKHDLDFLAVQEAKDYYRVLRTIPDYRYVAVSDHEHGRGASQNGILVRRNLTVTNARFGFFGDGWKISSRTTHAPATIPRVTIDRWLRVGSVHMPTPLVWRNGNITGPDERIDDYKALAVKITSILRRRVFVSKLIVGDWNEKPETHGKWSPRWIADSTGASIVAPSAREGHHRIDYPIFKGCRVSNIFKDLDFREGSDHEPVIFTVHRVGPLRKR